jgi:PKD repeat protein
MQLFIVGTFFVATTLAVQPAFAAQPTSTPKPGWGNGDKNHVHTGPPGISVRSDDNINISNTVNVLAEGSAKVTVSIVTTVLHSIFGK